jgi:hypothetical protein
LTGEILEGTLEVTATCDTNGTSTITFKASGVATGPYPGTFTETGTATVGPQTQNPAPDEAFIGPLVTFDAVFTITSGDIQITGTKELMAIITPPGLARGQCFLAGSGTDLTEITTIQTFSAVSYQAQISTNAGMYADQGGNPTVFAGRVFYPNQDRVGFQSFYQTFTSSGTATVPLNTPGQVTGGGQIAGDITFGLTAKSDSNGMKGNCTVIDRAADMTVKCLDVTAYSQTTTHATFWGNAKVNGDLTTYRIDVNDFAESGIGQDAFSISTGNGYVAGGVLTQGNIQVH